MQTSIKTDRHTYVQTVRLSQGYGDRQKYTDSEKVTRKARMQWVILFYFWWQIDLLKSIKWLPWLQNGRHGTQLTTRSWRHSLWLDYSGPALEHSAQFNRSRFSYRPRAPVYSIYIAPFCMWCCMHQRRIMKKIEIALAWRHRSDVVTPRNETSLRGTWLLQSFTIDKL